MLKKLDLIKLIVIYIVTEWYKIMLLPLNCIEETEDYRSKPVHVQGHVPVHLQQAIKVI